MASASADASHTEHVCGVCRKVLNNTIHIKCAVCPNVHICLECFACGVEFEDHHNDHDYRVVDNMKFPLYELDWGADEELTLLEAVEAVGLGHWTEVAARVKTKSAEECEQHYIKTYIDVPTAPLPQPSKGISKDAVANKAPSTHEGTTPAVTAGKETTTSIAASAPLQKQLGPAFAGFYPARGDFETEYMNAAEDLVKDVVFYDDDTAQDRQLKLAMINVYNRRLKGRLERRKFVQAYNLLPPAQLSSTQQAVIEAIKPAILVQSPEEHRRLLDNVRQVEELENRIKVLQRSMAEGIRRLSEVDFGSVDSEHEQQRPKKRRKPTEGTYSKRS